MSYPLVMGSDWQIKAAVEHSLKLSALALACLVFHGCTRSEHSWTADLTDPDPYVRSLASIGLELQAPRDAAPAIPVLLETIDRSELGLQRPAAELINYLGVAHTDQLLQILATEEFMTEDRRGAILNALVTAGAKAAGPIVRCLQGPGRAQAGDLGDALLLIGEPAVPAISELAASPDEPSLQHFAIFLLARLGQKARASLPILKAALDSPDPGVRQIARQAIELVDPESEAKIDTGVR